MRTLKEKFGLKIKSLRTDKGFTQEELAQLCGCSLETIGHIERGIYAPRFDLLEKLSKALECPVYELFIF